jgi:hypothetical protein
VNVWVVGVRGQMCERVNYFVLGVFLSVSAREVTREIENLLFVKE